MKAIILAGESPQDIETFGQGKALIHFNDRPLIQYTIDALVQSGLVEEILVIGNKEVLSPRIGYKVDKIIDGNKELLDNLITALSYFPQEENLLIATCDIPFIGGEAVSNFIKEAHSLQGDLYYPIIRRAVCEQRYPAAKRTYISMKDGEFTGGNLIMVNPQKIMFMEDEIRLLITHRKNPIKMLKALGPSLVVKMLAKRLTIKDLEKYIEEKFGIKGRAFVTPYPEVGTDIDRLEDIKILEKYI